MKHEDLEKHIGKVIFVKLKNIFHYKGKCIAVSDTILTLIDKFGKNVEIDINSIASLEVSNEQRKH